MKPTAIILSFILGTGLIAISHSGDAETVEASPAGGRLRQATLSAIRPHAHGGRAYRLVYYAEVPVEVFWRFKTDFKNDFLTTNRYILSHRFVSRNVNTVVTETKYKNAPDVYFRWKTTLHPSSHRLEYMLLNPKECGQKFNFGHITLESVGSYTRVTHVTYFDFFGAFFWVNFPGNWGMKTFLHYTASWEQETILRLKSIYLSGAAE